MQNEDRNNIEMNILVTGVKGMVGTGFSANLKSIKQSKT